METVKELESTVLSDIFEHPSEATESNGGSYAVHYMLDNGGSEALAYPETLEELVERFYTMPKKPSGGMCLVPIGRLFTLDPGTMASSPVWVQGNLPTNYGRDTLIRWLVFTYDGSIVWEMTGSERLPAPGVTLRKYPEILLRYITDRANSAQRSVYSVYKERLPFV